MTYTLLYFTLHHRSQNAHYKPMNKTVMQQRVPSSTIYGCISYLLIAVNQPTTCINASLLSHGTDANDKWQRPLCTVSRQLNDITTSCCSSAEYNVCPSLSLSLSTTACTVVQAVVKATSQSNGKGQILTPWGSETLERMSMKLGTYNRVADMPTHANPCGAATTWVVWANTWKNTCCGFLGIPFLIF